MNNKPVVVITGDPVWADAAAAALSERYHIERYTAQTGYIGRLADHQAALILVDGGDPHWRFWTTTPKTSPAARRVPLFVVTDDADMRAAALLAGADRTISSAELRDQIVSLAADYARVLDAETQERLNCECAEALPPRGVEGIAKFNAGEYYKQHDLFEAQWVETEGPVRDLYRAILQVGVAYYQIERGNLRGALKMLHRSAQWLAILPDVCQGVDVAQLKTDAARVRAELERLKDDPAGLAAFDKSLIKGVRLVDTP